MKYQLQKAFETKNVDLILKYASEIGHYIGDAHVPLHTTENYNGQLTGQRGIHGLWESRIVEMDAENYDYFVGKGKYISNMNDFAWNAVYTSHMAVDSVLRFERELTAAFPSDKKYSYEKNALDNISFTLKKGSRLGVIGENGSGKSSAVRRWPSGQWPLWCTARSQRFCRSGKYVFTAYLVPYSCY